MKWHTLALAHVVALVAASSNATAKDLKALSRLLTPAYTGMNYAAICSSDSDWLSAQPAGRRGYAVHYALHVKDEIVASLTYEEALAVLRLAADAARQDARAQLKDHVRADARDVEKAQLRAWCSGFADHVIEAFIQKHDGEHPSFLVRLKTALTTEDQ